MLWMPTNRRRDERRKGHEEKTDGGHNIPEEDLREMQEEEKENFPRVWKPIQELADFAGRWEP